MRFRRRAAAWYRCAAVALLLAACSKRPPSGTPPVSEASDAGTRIRYYAGRIAEHPRVYASYLGLAGAYLDEARRTHDPLWVAKARAATQISMDIVPGLEGHKMEARIAAFRHRFAEALTSCRRAAELLSTDMIDGALTALFVEAHMGLGQYDEARRLLPPDGAPLANFHTAAAMGHWLVSQGREAEAAAAFEAASRFAAAEEVKPLAAWAYVMAAGADLEVPQLDAARSHLRAAAALDPTNRELRIHEAELMVAEGREADAVARYEELCAEAPDPVLHHRIFMLARGRGDDEGARAHFGAAERLLTHVLEAGEVYTVEELARLYLDADVNADRAFELATKNIEWKRDRSASETLEAARRAAGRARDAMPINDSRKRRPGF